MQPKWILFSLQVFLVTLTLSEAGKKGSTSGIIVINNTGGGKCGGSAKTIVKTGGKDKKGKGKGKGHTIIASSGGGGGGCGCKENDKVVHVPVPVHVPMHHKHMDRRNSGQSPIGYESAAGTKIMPVFVAANVPVPVMPPHLGSIGGRHNGLISSFSGSYGLSPFSMSTGPVGDYGLDPGMSEARTMFQLLPAQHLGHHHPHHHHHHSHQGHGSHHGYGHGHPHSSHHHHHHQGHQHHLHGDSGLPYASNLPIFEPIQSEGEMYGHGSIMGNGPVSVAGDDDKYRYHAASSPPASSSLSSSSSSSPSSLVPRGLQRKPVDSMNPRQTSQNSQTSHLPNRAPTGSDKQERPFPEADWPEK